MLRLSTLPPSARLASVLAVVAGLTTATPGQAQNPPTAAATPDVPAALHVPAGFGVSVFASGLKGARLMAVSPEGTLVVAKRGEVVALPDANHDGVAEPRVLLENMTYAHSLAFRDGYLYIGTTPAVLRVKWERGGIVGTPETYVALPSSAPAMHTSRSIAFGPDGRLFVGIGSSCNVCVEDDPRRTTIQVFDGPGSRGRTFAAGLHNAVGFDWDPATGRMWAVDTGQEKLGDDYPPDEINLIEDGKHYGFPYFTGKSTASTVPELEGVTRPLTATQVVAPAFELPAHASPLGMTFYRGTAFPEPYRGSMYIAIHGSSARSTKIGYSIVRIAMKDGRPAGREDFVTGWLSGDTFSGRPAGVVTGADGALYISDDNKGFVYRVVAAGQHDGHQAAPAPTAATAAAAKVVLTQALPKMDGATLGVSMSEVRYPPGGVSGPHQHSCPVVGYVLEGAIRWAINGQPARILKAGDSFFETLGDVHSTSANASATEPARFLAIFTCDGGKSPVTTQLPPKP